MGAIGSGEVFDEVIPRSGDRNTGKTLGLDVPLRPLSRV